MARNNIPDSQLKQLTTANKVAISALDIDGASAIGEALADADLFIVDNGAGGTNRKITAATMQDYFSSLDVLETSTSQNYQILFADDNTNTVYSESSYSAFQTSRLQESSVTSSTTSLTFSPEYGDSLSAGEIIAFKDSSSNRIAFTVSSSVSSSATSFSVAYLEGGSNATSMNKSSIAEVVKLSASAGSGDGKVRVDGSGLLYNPSSDLLTVGGNVSVGDNLLLASDSAVLSLGADAEVTLTHVHDTGLLLNGAMQLQFRDSAVHISSDADGYLSAQADTGVNINIGGTDELAITSAAATFGGNIVIPDAGNIGSASDTDAMAISSGGVVTFSQRDVHSAGITIADGAQIGSASDADAMSIASDGVVTFSQRDVHSAGITVADGGQIGSASDADAMAISSGGVVTFSQRDVHSAGITIADGAQIGSASDADAMAISSGGVVTFSQRDVHSAGITVADGATIGSATTSNAITIAANGKITIAGDLEVDGTTTTVDTTNLLVKDKLVTLNDGGSASSGGGAGIEVEEDGSATGFFKVASDRAGWELQAPGNSNTLTIDATASAVLLDVGADVTIDGTLSVEAASVINQDLSSDSTSAALGVLTMATRLAADANGGADIGTSSAGFGDVYLADDKKLQLGDSQDFTIEFDADGDSVAQFAGSNMRLGHGAATQLQFRDADVYINSDADGFLNARADSGIDLAIGSSDIASVRSGGLMPGADNGRALGASSLAWSDLYLGDGGVLRFGPSSYGATLTHSKVDRFGSDIKDDRLTSSFSAFQVSRIVGSTLSSSTSSISMSPEVGTSIASGTTIVFTAGSDTIAYDVSSSVSSGDSSISVSYNAGASSATSVSVSGISNVSKDHGAVKSAIQSSSLTDGMSSLSFADGDTANAFNSKIGSNGTVVFVDGSITATLTLASYSSGSSISLDSASLSGGSSLSPSSSDSIKVKASDQAQKLTLDGNYTSLNIVDHDGSGYGLELAGTLVTSTAAELNILDGATVTTAEVNVLDGDTAATSTTLVAADRFIVNDNGTMKQVAMSDLATMLSGAGLVQSGASLSINVVRDNFVKDGTGVSGGNTICALSAEPVEEESVDVYLNGVLQVPAGTLTPANTSQVDYTYGGSEGSRTITFEDALLDDDVVTIKYIAKSE